MNLSDPIAGLEIGTVNCVMAVGEKKPDGGLNIPAIAEIPSDGVQKSTISDMAQARHSITSNLKKLAEINDYAIGHAHLAVGGAHILAEKTTVQIQIETGIVREEEIRELEELALESALPADRHPLELHLLSYTLDNSGDPVISPAGMTGRVLTRTSLCVHGKSARISDAINAAAQAHLEIANDHVWFAGTCAALAVLTPRQRRDGALVIDLGGGSTSFTLWHDGALMRAGVVGVGGKHVTNDIADAFNIQRPQAEQLKISHASAIISEADTTTRIPVAGSIAGTGPNAATISRHALNTVVNARMEELFTIIRTILDEFGELHAIHGGIHLTGGGSGMDGIAQLAQNVFGIQAKTGEIIPSITGLESYPNPAAYATVAGLLLTAQPAGTPDSASARLAKFLKGLFTK